MAAVVRFGGKLCHVPRTSISSWRRSFILGIETSCDDTAAAVISLQGSVLGECLSSQLSTRFGGVIPSFAMHFHAQKIQEVVTLALQQANVRLEDMTAVAVTNRPGLKGPLIIGTDYAKYLSVKYSKPIIPVHHMMAHALTVRLENNVPFPFMILLISGGHCLLGVAQEVDKFLILGSSLDDSPGEALDKLARRLKVHNLPNMRDLSGGRAIELLAQNGDHTRLELPIPMRGYRDCNFSFAGFKGKTKYYIESEERRLKLSGDQCLPQIEDICSSIQFTVAKHLAERVQRGIQYSEGWDVLPPGGSLVVSGGVASNAYIRSSLETVCSSLGWKTIFPQPRLCTDNGIMIAWAGLELWREGRGIVPHSQAFAIPVEAKCPIGEDISSQVTEKNIKCKWVKLN